MSPRPSGCPLQCPDRPATDLVRAAILNLSQGAPDLGGNLVACALERDPSHRRANKIQRQLNLKPEDYFGTDQTTNYRIVEGDTLASIAQQCLEDKDNFLALSKLNNIRDPRNIQIGQEIRIPGQQPCVDANLQVNLLIEEARKELSDGYLENSYKKIAEALRLKNNGEVNQLHQKISSAFIEELHTNAAILSSEGNCPSAKKLWNQILRIDRNDQLARNFLDTASC